MSHQRWPVLLALAALTTSGGSLFAGDLYSGKEPAALASAALPKSSEIKSFTVHPAKIALKGIDDAQQLLLTAELADGRLQDLTGDVKYEAADQKVVRITS